VARSDSKSKVLRNGVRNSLPWESKRPRAVEPTRPVEQSLCSQQAIRQQVKNFCHVRCADCLPRSSDALHSARNFCFFHTEPSSIRKSSSNALRRIAPFSDCNRNIHLKYQMPLWASGVANADQNR
jgi:hypothetical protein